MYVILYKGKHLLAQVYIEMSPTGYLQVQLAVLIAYMYELSNITCSQPEGQEAELSYFNQKF